MRWEDKTTDGGVQSAPGLARLSEKKRQQHAFITARLILVALFIGLWFVFLPAGYQMPFPFLLALLAEQLMLIACRAATRRAQTARQADAIHVVLLAGELVAHSVMFYFLGGLSWLGAVAYIYAAMYASIFLTPGQAAFFAVVLCSAFLAVVSLDATGAVPHVEYLPQGPDRYRDPGFLVPTSVSFVGVIATVTFWMVFIGNELRRERDVALASYDELLRTQAELRNLNEELEAKVEERTRVLFYRAEHDNLTGLLNRGAITRRCNEVLASARRSGAPVAVIVGDGDNFKTCNDTGGHAYGDDVIRLIGEAFREVTRESDFVGRMGGDEFLAVLPNTDEAGAIQYCRRLTSRLSLKAHFATDRTLPFPTLSLGIAIFPRDGSDTDELVRVADRAMYTAKFEGGGRWLVGREEPQRHNNAADPPAA